MEIGYWDALFGGRTGYYQDITDFDYPEIVKHINEEDTVLDCGCGAGILAGFLPDNTYVGLDSSLQAIRLALKNYKKTFVVAKIEEMKTLFNDNEFDIVVMRHCLNTLGDWQEAVRQMFRIAKKKVIIFNQRPFESPTRLVDKVKEACNWEIGYEDFNSLARSLSDKVSYGMVKRRGYEENGTASWTIIIEKHL